MRFFATAHSFRADWLILDVDLTSLPAGKQAEKSVKGYFSVLASQYGEIVRDALYPGNALLVQVLPELIEQAEGVLGLTPFRRRRTILRFDGGGGGVERINGLLSRGYALVGKEYSARRARLLANSVTEWVSDSAQPNRQMGGCPRRAMSTCVPCAAWRYAPRVPKASGTTPCCCLLVCPIGICSR